VDKALAIVKKNLLSIICGVVAILAVVVLFYPLSGFRDHFRADMNTRALVYAQAKQLLTAKRLLPIVDPSKPEPMELPYFPNKNQIDEGNRAKDKVQQQSQQMMAQALQYNQAGHDLLLAPDILPNPGDRVFNYETAYIKEVKEGLPARLGAVLPPNADTIKTRIAELHKAEVDDKVFSIAGVEQNRKALEDEFIETAAKVPDELRLQSAEQNKLYMDPNSALTIHRIMSDPIARPGPADIWYAQLTLWVQEDVASSIIAANSAIPNSNIKNDAVKRIVEIRIPVGPAAYVLPAGAATGGTAAPAPAAPAGDDSADVRDFTRSPTGHICNDLYDVLAFSMILEVDQRQIPTIIHELQKNKFMTVVGLDISAIDPIEADAQGFIYGTAPMVRLSLNLETLFMRKWTVPLMPPTVQQDLRIVAGPGSGVNGGGGGGNGGGGQPVFTPPPPPVPAGGGRTPND
jgi:hypothetical protein